MEYIDTGDSEFNRFEIERMLQEAALEDQKEKEREAIRVLLDIKRQRVQTVKTNSQSKLEEVEQAMYDKSHNDLPRDMEGALTGKAADAAKNFLTGLKKPEFKTPVKGG